MRQLVLATGEAHRGRSASPSSAIVTSGQPPCLARTALAKAQSTVASILVTVARQRLAHLGEQRLRAELILGEDHLHLAIGRQGRVLSEVTTPTASYTFKGDEGYVRAKVLESNGKVAWIQPVPVGASGPK